MIDDGDFSLRYQKVKQSLAENRLAQDRIADNYGDPDTATESLNASFEEISDFGSNWGFLDPFEVSVLLNAGDGTFFPKRLYTGVEL